MHTKLLTIQEASKMSQKSTQTIRRLIKHNKLKCKRRRTPQGFHYEVQKDSLIKYFDLNFEEEVESNDWKRKENDVFELAVEPDIVRSKRKKKSAIYDVKIPVETDDIDGITIEETLEFPVADSKVGGENVESVESEVVVDSGGGAHTGGLEEATQFATILQQMLKQHQEDKDRLFALLEQFQKRTLILEERIKRLEAPKRNWWRLW